MKRTVAALYETRAEAERAQQALLAAHLCKAEDVEICDEAHEGARRHHKGLTGWLGDLFAGHEDHRLYGEGLRRGHVLLKAKVDDLNEARAAIVMDDAAMNLVEADRRWREDGWKPEAASSGQTQRAYDPALQVSPGEDGRGAYSPTSGSSVRAYSL